MKASYFNPEVHSLTFRNFSNCGSYQCGGMCCTALSEFYLGNLIDCEAKRSSFEKEIWNNQVGIIGSDCEKSCRWGNSMNAINKIANNIAIGRPTLLYLDKVDWSLTEDHFVVAFALDEVVDNVQKIYIYDPNYVYKRHFEYPPVTDIYCKDPDYPYSTLGNYDKTLGNNESKAEDTLSYLEVNYIKKTFTLYPVIPSDPKKGLILGFKWYGQDTSPGAIHVSHYTDERNIQHACKLDLISINSPEIIKTIPLISHTIKISKDGNIPADLKLYWEKGQDLYESGDYLFSGELKNVFDPSYLHIGFQKPKGYFEKSYKVYQKYEALNAQTIILLKSNFIEQPFQLEFPYPRLKYFSAFVEGTPEHYHAPYYFAEIVNNQIIKVQGLNKNNVKEVEKVPAVYSKPFPVNHISVSYTGTDWQSALNSGEYALYDQVFLLGYINSNVVIELIHNGLYTEAKVKMTSDNPKSSEEKLFINNTAEFTLSGGTQKLYDSDTLTQLSFEINGGGISAEFSEHFIRFLQYRCLIIHEPLFLKPLIFDLDIHIKFLEKLLINIPLSNLIPELEKRFSLELKKHPRNERKKFKELFIKELVKRCINIVKTDGNYEQLYKIFINSYNSFNDYRKEKFNIILDKSKNYKEFKQNIEILEEQIRQFTGKALIENRHFKRILSAALKGEWE